MSNALKRTIIALLSSLAVFCAAMLFTGTADYVKADPVFAMADSAQIRATKDNGGIRFISYMDAEGYAAAAAKEDARFGMLIIPADYLIVYAEQITAAGNDYVTAFEKANVNVLNLGIEPFPANENMARVEENPVYYCMRGVISNVLYANSARKFVGIGYAYGDGAYTYATFDKNGKSREEVAKAALDNYAAGNIEIEEQSVLILNGYVILANEYGKGTSEEDANADVSASLKSLYRSFTSANYSFFGSDNESRVDMEAGQKLTMSFDILSSVIPNVSFGFIVNSCDGWVNGGVYVSGSAGLFIHRGNPYPNAHDCWIVPREGSPVQLDADTHNINFYQLMQAGKSVKIEYSPYIDENTLGSIAIYSKDIADEEYIKLGEYNELGEIFAPKNKVGMGFYANGEGLTLNIANLEFRLDDAEVSSFGYVHNDCGEYCATRKVTLDNDGFITETYVPFGKRMTDPEEAGVECWLTENNEEFDFDTPVTEDITLTAKAKQLPLKIKLVGEQAWFGAQKDEALNGNTLTMQYDVASSSGVAAEGVNRSFAIAILNKGTLDVLNKANGQNPQANGYCMMFATAHHGAVLQKLRAPEATAEGTFAYNTLWEQGYSVRIVYQPYVNESITGSISVYRKSIADAEDNFVLVGALKNLNEDHAPDNASFWLGTMDSDYTVEMVVENYSMKTSDGRNFGFASCWAKNSASVTVVTSTESKTYNYLSDAPSAGMATFGSETFVDIGDKELVMQFTITESSLPNSWQIGFAVTNNGGWAIYPYKPGMMIYARKHEYREAFLNKDGSNVDTTVTIDNSFVSFGDLMSAGTTVKAVYKGYTSDSDTGYFRIYAKKAGNSDFTLMLAAENLDATLGFTQNVGIGFFTQDAGNSMTITDYTITCGNKVISGLGTCQATLTEVTG